VSTPAEEDEFLSHLKAARAFMEEMRTTLRDSGRRKTGGPAVITPAMRGAIQSASYWSELVKAVKEGLKPDSGADKALDRQLVDRALDRTFQSFEEMCRRHSVIGDN
jgi:hypothetical protein